MGPMGHLGLQELQSKAHRVSAHVPGQHSPQDPQYSSLPCLLQDAPPSTGPCWSSHVLGTLLSLGLYAGCPRSQKATSSQPPGLARGLHQRSLTLQ